MRLRDFSLERKFFLVILPICLIPAVVFTTLVIEGSLLTHEETMGSELEKQTALLTDRFDQFMDDRLNRLRLALRRMVEDPLSAEETSTAVQELRSGELADVALISGSGEGIEELTPAPESETARLLELLDLSALDEWPEPPLRGATTDLRFSMQGRLQPFSLTVMAFPSRSGGTAYFLISTERLIKQFRQSLSIAPDYMVVVTGSGATVHPWEVPPEEGELAALRRSADDAGEGKWFKGEIQSKPYLLVQATPSGMKQRLAQWSPATSWKFIMAHDLEGFLGPRDRLIWMAVIVALLLVLALMALATVLSRALVRPLKDLQRQANLLAAGRRDVVAAADSRDEIGELARTFNTMSGQLARTYRDLEHKVEESRIRNEHINAINEIAHANLQAQELGTIFENLRRDLVRIVPFDALWLAQLDGDSRDLKLVEVHPGRLAALLEDGRIPLSNSLHGASIEQEETLHAEIGPTQRGDFFETRAFAAEGYQSYMIAPLPSRQGILGVLGVASTSPDAFNRELAEVMTSVAGAVSVAMEQSGAFQQISQFAQELERKVMDRTNELEKARLKLSQTEKYFALGRLAGNLAHEINNPLGIIKNYLELARGNLTRAEGGRRQTDPNADHLQIINEEVERIAKLVRKLLDLHRPTEQSVAPVDINETIGEILALLEENLKGQGVRVVRRLEGGIGRPIASPDLIRQVFINLIRNAQDAMERGGELTVETTTGPSESEGGERLIVRIADSGCGILPENLGQIFDPFFTTKSREKGTGLGLCVSYSIVHLYGGTIDVASQPERGTTVTVTLPLERRLPEAAPTKLEGQRV